MTEEGYNASRRRLIAYLVRGGAVRREEPAGAVPARWVRASLVGGRSWLAEAGDRLKWRGYFTHNSMTYLIVMSGPVLTARIKT